MIAPVKSASETEQSEKVSSSVGAKQLHTVKLAFHWSRRCSHPIQPRRLCDLANRLPD